MARLNPKGSIDSVVIGLTPDWAYDAGRVGVLSSSRDENAQKAADLLAAALKRELEPGYYRATKSEGNFYFTRLPQPPSYLSH